MGAVFLDEIPAEMGWYWARIYCREGRSTWVSVEPVLVTAAGKVVSRLTHGWETLQVERYKFGPRIKPPE